jgi:uncharacterized protein (TIGR02145 family)
MKILNTLALVLFSIVALSQAPQLIPYQAIARDAAGQPLSSTAVNARFTIHEGTALGPNIWQELQTVSTSSLGLFTVQLGSNVSLGNLNWASGSKFMQVEIDLGNGFVDIGTQQMLSVPYALHSDESRISGNGVANVSLYGDTLYLANGDYLIVPGISSANAPLMIFGCTDSNACNYYSEANASDGSCFYPGNSCDDYNIATINDTWTSDCVCQGGPGDPRAEHSCGAQNIHNTNANYGSMVDQEGNSYKTIFIGNQEWMAENLTTSIYRNGDAIDSNLSAQEWAYTYLYEQGAWSHSNTSGNDCPYGKLYNWYACTDERELCPTGWHLPSNLEWDELVNFLGGDFFAGGKMKATGTTNSDYGFWLAPNIAASNSSGFSALPAGGRISELSNSNGIIASFWSSSEISITNAYAPTLASNSRNFFYNEDFKVGGASVRCLRDEINSGVGGCTDNQACNFDPIANSENGSCYYVGDACDDGSNATINDSWSTDCVCLGEQGIIGTAHSCGAQAVHNANVSYGQMSDQAGNVYKTIIIGTQEWMAENLNTDIYRNGDLIPTDLSNAEWSATNSGAWTAPDNDLSLTCPFGKLYNWYAVVDSRQLCPAGWQIPSYNDYTILSLYLGGNETAGGKMKNTGTQENASWLWELPNEGASNSSGFSALPGGQRNNDGAIQYFGYFGNWWTSTVYDNDNASFMSMTYEDDNLRPNTFGMKRRGFSVRCIRE